MTIPFRLTVTRLFRKNPHFIKHEISLPYTQQPNTCRWLNKIKLVHVLPFHIFKIPSNNILPSIPKSSKSTFSFIFPNTIFHEFLSPCNYHNFPHPFLHLQFDQPNKLCSVQITQFPPAGCSSLVLALPPQSQIPPSALYYRKTLSLHSVLTCDTEFHNHTKQQTVLNKLTVDQVGVMHWHKYIFTKVYRTNLMWFWTCIIVNMWK